MEKSLFRRNLPKDPAPTPYELIEPEIVHLKKGYSIRYGPKGKKGPSPWVVGIAFCGLAWLYLMDPIIHAWYKGEAITWPGCVSSMKASTKRSIRWAACATRFSSIRGFFCRRTGAFSILRWEVKSILVLLNFWTQFPRQYEELSLIFKFNQ